MDNSNKINIGDIIDVTVKNFTNYGVFADYTDGYKGLIHISNITNGFVKNAQEYFSIDEVVKAEVISVDEQSKKIGLSTKQFNLKAKNQSFNTSYSNNKRYKKF